MIGAMRCSLLLWGLAVLSVTTLASGQDASGSDPVPVDGSIRRYYIKAEVMEWDYAPLGINQCSGKEYTEDEAIFVTEGLGSKYLKAVFREYTDGTFEKRKRRPAEEAHMGLLGPPIYAAVGDVVVVTLMNDLPFPINFAVQGVALRDGVLNTGETAPYSWAVAEVHGPGEAQESSVMSLYRSTLDQAAHANAGLLGPIVITRRGAADENGRANDVDVDHFLVFEVWNENESPLLEDNLAGRTAEDFGLSEDEFEEANLMHGVNGYVYCNQREMVSEVGDTVRWHVAAVGNEVDLHTAHWHGNVLMQDGHRMDSLMLIPGIAYSLDMEPDSPGTWLLHCHVNDHLIAGMLTVYTVKGQRPQVQRTGVTRQIFIAAEMVEWDYAPAGLNLCSGSGEPFGDDENVFLEASPSAIGQRYLKAQYVQYTDASFTTPVPRSQEDAYEGLLGPTIRAAVGDTIRLTFTNKDVPFPVSIHPHGVQYEKDSEGAPYVDGTTGRDKLDDRVEVGDVVEMTWDVVDRSGPGKNDLSSLIWMYHSHADEVADTNTGLMGAIIVTRKENAKPDGTPDDVDREIVLFFSVLNEAQSLLFDMNIDRFLPSMSPGEVEALKEDEDFQESNLMHQINGYLYCNSPDIAATQGQKVRFHVMALGTEVDMHTPNMQAASIISTAEPEETLQLIAGGMQQADSIPRMPGNFMIACRVADHITAGMIALLKVNDAGLAPVDVFSSVRIYFIAAEEVEWDYTPYGYDGCTGEPFDEDQQVFTKTTPNTLGSTYKKAIYTRYTNASFTQRMPSNPLHGVVGPMIEAEAGDLLHVVLKNKLADQDVNFDVGGLVAAGEDATGPTPVPPGDTRTYEFVIPAEAGPCQGCTPNAASYIYLSSVDIVGQTNAGLLGPLLVYAPGTLGPDGSSKMEGINAVVPLFFNILNENESPFLDANVAAAEAMLNSTIDTQSEDFEESNLMHAINGYLFCNMPRVTMLAGSTIRMVVMGLGSETDMHVPVFSGNRLLFRGGNVAAVPVMPSTSYVVDLKAPEGPGRIFDFYCDVHDHFLAGMRAQLFVEDRDSFPE